MASQEIKEAVGLERTLRDAGLRSTGPRRKILDLFESTRQRHLTAEDVYTELSDKGEPISLATVYRVLAQFESAGLLVRHHLEAGKSVFELSRLGDHNHLICLQCGLMTCFTDDRLDGRQRDIARQHGFELKEYSLYTYVNCARDNCPNREAGRPVEGVGTGEHASRANKA
ncbi:MAG: ferric iron uptake transcriptional regulator [Myxococcales bacterium]|nr:ferric iron uptake transcriptional regulator [Myxococcales bacterium]